MAKREGYHANEAKTKSIYTLAEEIDEPSFEPGNFKGTRQKISKLGSAYLRKTGYEIMTSLNAIKPIED